MSDFYLFDSLPDSTKYLIRELETRGDQFQDHPFFRNRLHMIFGSALSYFMIEFRSLLLTEPPSKKDLLPDESKRYITHEIPGKGKNGEGDKIIFEFNPTYKESNWMKLSIGCVPVGRFQNSIAARLMKKELDWQNYMESIENPLGFDQLGARRKICHLGPEQGEKFVTLLFHPISLADLNSIYPTSRRHLQKMNAHLKRMGFLSIRKDGNTGVNQYHWNEELFRLFKGLLSFGWAGDWEKIAGRINQEKEIVPYIYSFGIYFSPLDFILQKYIFILDKFFRRKNIYGSDLKSSHTPTKMFCSIVKSRIDQLPSIRRKYPSGFWDLGNPPESPDQEKSFDRNQSRKKNLSHSKGDQSKISKSKMADRIRKKAVENGPKKKGPSRRDRMIEYWNTLPYIRKHHDQNSQVYRKASGLIRKLRAGKIGLHPLDQDWLNIQGISKKAWNGTKWSDKKIKDTLTRLAMIFDPDFYPADKERLPRDLPTLIYNPRSRKSLFLKYYFEDPEPLSAPEDEDYLVKMLKKATHNYTTKLSKAQKLGMISRMNKIWKWVEDLPEKEKGVLKRDGKSNPKSFLSSFIDFLDFRNKSPRPFPYRIGSDEFLMFLNDIDNRSSTTGLLSRYIMKG